MPLRIPNAVFALLFAYATVVQYNDPDPIRWVAIYVAAAAICALSIARRLSWLLPLGLGLGALLWLATLIPGAFSSGEFRGDEIQRESGGLLVIGTWMLLLALRTRPSSATDNG